MLNRPIFRTALSLLICTSLISCTTIQNSSLGKGAKEAFASEDPCSNNSRNWGVLIGTLAGGLAGYYLGDKKTGVAIGAGLAGAALGGLIGADMDKKRCELSKIAKQYDLQIVMSSVNANGDVIDNGGKDQTEQSMGMSVTLGEKDGRGHFEKDSDQLTTKAKQYFADIANTYNPQLAAKQISNAKEREAYLVTAKQKKILLIGHTDDSGETQYNATLSEKRAKAVAKFLKDHGIAEEILFFQGAGESLPIADNRSEDGRAKNRRVELVEVTGEGNFQKYLEARKPKHEFYRTVNPDTVQAERKVSKPAVMAKTKSVTTSAPVIAAPVTSKTAAADTSTGNKIAPKTAAAKTSTGPQYNFGGQQLLASNAQIDLGKRIEEDAGFNLIAKAYAEESVVLSSCNRDRPRVSGSVKALKDGKSYATTEYLTGLYNTSWHDTLNGNLVMLNRVGILRDSSAPSTPPELKIYAAYDAQKSKTAKPDVQLSPVVNIYRGTKGVLYRVFAQGAGGIQCMDVLFPLQGGLQAKNGKLLYRQQGEMFAADYKPKMIR